MTALDMCLAYRIATRREEQRADDNNRRARSDRTGDVVEAPIPRFRGFGPRTLRRLPKQDLSQIVLQQKGIRDAQAGEQPDDVAIEERGLTAACRRIRAMLQRHLVADDVLGVVLYLRLRGAEEAEQRPVRSQDPRQLVGDLRRRRLVEIVDQIPAENAVDGVRDLRESLLQKGRQLFELAAAHVAIDVGKDVLDENLAAELLAKKADVAPDDRAQIEQDGRIVGRKARQELAESLRREHLGLDAAVGTDRQHVIAQLNRPFDVTLDGQILATVQLALDDDGLPNIHDVLLHMLTCVWPRTGGSRYRRRRRLRRRRLPAGRSHRFIAFPHVTFLRLTAAKLGDLPSLLGPKGSGQYRGLFESLSSPFVTAI